MKTFINVSILLLISVSFGFTTNPSEAKDKLVVVIDVAHGGNDHGTQLDEISEKDIVLQIAQRLIDQNNETTIEWHFTRNHDRALSLADRVAFINTIQPDIVLSLHVNNSAHVNTSGMDIYVSKDATAYERSEKMAARLQATINEYGLTTKTEIKHANFYLLKHATVPVLSIELGFLSNPIDRAMLTNTVQQQSIANALTSFLIDPQ